MIISTKVKMKWNARNKKRFVDLGYKYTKMHDEFQVSVNHLSEGSNAVIKVSCDFCGDRYDVVYERRVAMMRRTVSKKDTCKRQKCINKKIVESNLEKYGVEHHIRSDVIQKKINNTLAKYGVDNVFQLDSVKKKIVETNLKKYGVKSFTQTEEYIRKKTETSMKRYGASSHMLTPKYRNMFRGENSPAWKGGTKRHRMERSTPEYNDWRRDVFGRDGYRCRRCLAKSGKGLSVVLNAHHVLNFRDYVDLRYEVSNGITFCKECHLKFHSIYGKENNNQAQVDEFISNYGKNVC